jgi:SET domain-containing protein
LIIKQSNIHGFGVFSLEKFKEESILFFLYGEEIDLTNKNIDDFNCEWNALSLNTLLIRESRTTYGFINHSNNPNCYIDFKNKCVKTLKKIEPNEELLLNYEKEPLPIDYLNSHGSTYL